MGLNKQELDRVVAFVKAVKELPGNEEFIADLRMVLREIHEKKESSTQPSAVTATVNTTSNPKIDEIYELCIEKIARQQAEGVYAKFPIKELIPGLVDDYVRMESFRRKDNFGDFCLALYQQIERITNSLYSQLSNCTFLDAIAQQPAYATSSYSNGMVVYNIFERKPSGKYIVDSFIAKKGKDGNVKAMDATKMVIYFIIGSASTMDLELQNGLYEIYCCRNLNHRGGFQTETQSQTTNKIVAQKEVYYLQFLGSLISYISGIIKGYENNVLENIEKWSKSLKPQSTTVKITSILPSVFYAKDEEGNSFGSNCKCPTGKNIGDEISVIIEKCENNGKEESVITKVL